MNKSKYALNLSLSIVLMVISSIAAIYHLLSIIVNLDIKFVSSMHIILYITSAIMSVANFCILSISIRICANTNKRIVSGNNTMIILIALLIVSLAALIGRVSQLKAFIYFLEIIVYLGLLAFTIATVYFKGEDDRVHEQLDCNMGQTTNPSERIPSQTPSELTLGQKIAQIKRMRDLCLVSDEQAQEAIKRLIDAELKK